MEWASFFVSGDFWVKVVFAGIIIKFFDGLLSRGARAGKLGLSRWFGTVSAKRRREWHGRVLAFARYREAYEFMRHQNRASQNGANFMMLAGVLFYVAAVAAASIHVSVFWMLLVASVFMIGGGSYVDATANRMAAALNAAGRIYVRREARSRLGSGRKAREYLKSIR